MNDSRFAEKLREMSSEELAALLVGFADRSPTLRRELVALTATPKELATTAKKTIALLRSEDTYYDHQSIQKLKLRIHATLAQIETVSKVSPNTGLDLICDLIACEANVLATAEDYLGIIKNAFKYTMSLAAADIVRRVSDEQHIIACLKRTLRDDPNGSRCDLIDIVASELTENVLRALLDYTTQVQERQPGIEHYEDSKLGYVQQRIIVALGDTERFIALCSRNGRVRDLDILTLVQMYIDHEQYDLAQMWLDKIAPNIGILTQRYALQSAIAKALGRPTQVQDYFRDRFWAKPDEKSLLTLAKHLTTDEVRCILDDFSKQMMEAPRLLSSTLKVLISGGRAHEAEAIVAARNTYADADPGSWTRIAKAFEESGLHFGASVAYRVVLNDILENRKSGSYYSAVDYYSSLWELSLHVTDWRGLIDQNAYVEELFARHADLSAFWIRAEFSYKPPKISRFLVPPKQRYRRR